MLLTEKEIKIYLQDDDEGEEFEEEGEEFKEEDFDWEEDEGGLDEDGLEGEEDL
jgi:hypothetical protein